VSAPAIDGPFLLCDRPAVAGHVRGVMKALQAAGIVPRDRDAIGDGESCLMIADDAGAVAAFVVFYQIDDARLWIDLVHTAEFHRRKRYALALMREIANVAVRWRVAKLMFGTGIDNGPMQRLGQACGFFTDHHVCVRRLAIGTDMASAPVGLA
jgi:GNAT superfamily N-acetyltransferase